MEDRNYPNNAENRKNIRKVKKVLLLLKSMVYESTGPLELVRFAKYYKRTKGLEVTIVLWGPMGILLGKSGKIGRMRYEQEMKECIDMGIKVLCCELAAKLIGLERPELMDGIEMVPSFVVADLLLEYQEKGDLIISL
ncbi:MAG: DsrE family protein [Promethearchaeota archaeon]